MQCFLSAVLRRQHLCTWGAACTLTGGARADLVGHAADVFKFALAALTAWLRHKAGLDSNCQLALGLLLFCLGLFICFHLDSCVKGRADWPGQPMLHLQPMLQHAGGYDTPLPCRTPPPMAAVSMCAEYRC